MIFLKSEDVRIFPCTYRGGFYDADIIEQGQPIRKSYFVPFHPEAELLTEYNYTNLPGLAFNLKSYVIEAPEAEGKVKFKFCLDGYYIEATFDETVLKQIQPSWATSGICCALAYEYNADDGQQYLCSFFPSESSESPARIDVSLDLETQSVYADMDTSEVFYLTGQKYQTLLKSSTSSLFKPLEQNFFCTCLAFFASTEDFEATISSAVRSTLNQSKITISSNPLIVDSIYQQNQIKYLQAVDLSRGGLSIGENTEGPGIVIGDGAKTDSLTGIALGPNSSAKSAAVAIGPEAEAWAEKAVAIGHQALVEEESGTAIGPNTEAAKNSLAVGPNAQALAENSVAIGPGAEAKARNSTAIGPNAKVNEDEVDTTVLGSEATKSLNQIRLNASPEQCLMTTIGGTVSIAEYTDLNTKTLIKSMSDACLSELFTLTQYLYTDINLWDIDEESGKATLNGVPENGIVVVPAKVKVLDKNFPLFAEGLELAKIKEFRIPSSVVDIDLDTIRMLNKIDTMSIYVDPEHAQFAVRDRQLYQK